MNIFISHSSDQHFSHSKKQYFQEHRMSETWEALRKKARSTENSIDVKLVSLNKLTASSHGKYYQEFYDFILRKYDTGSWHETFS